MVKVIHTVICQKVLCAREWLVHRDNSGSGNRARARDFLSSLIFVARELRQNYVYINQVTQSALVFFLVFFFVLVFPSDNVIAVKWLIPR